MAKEQRDLYLMSLDQLGVERKNKSRELVKFTLLYGGLAVSETLILLHIASQLITVAINEKNVMSGELMGCELVAFVFLLIPTLVASDKCKEKRQELEFVEELIDRDKKR